MISFMATIIDAITTPIRQLFTWFVQCLPGVRVISRWTIPTKWSMMALLFLLLIWVAAFVKHVFEGEEKEGWDSYEWLVWGVYAPPMIAAITIFVYFFIKLFLKEEVSRFPELDRIWREGLDQADAKEISIVDAPLFLVLGTSQQREVRSMTGLMGIEFAVETPVSVSPPISFFASERGIFVFLNGCNCISRLSQSTSTSSIQNNANPSSTGELHQNEVGGTIDASHLAPPAYKTMQAPEAFVEADPFTPGGTMLLAEGQDLSDILRTNTVSKVLTSQEIFDSEDRLRHVCRLIKKARLPVCPINGIVTTLPFELIETSSAQLQVAIQKDLAILREEFQVRCPNTALVTGMEIEEGFIELINRLPQQKVSENRFGKGADLWVSPESKRLDAVAIHAVATFEDWIYMLFQEENALKKKHNSRLFSMLCRVRGAFSENLRAVLSNGFGFDPNTQPNLAYEQFLFGGCYFSAVGATASQQAFVKSVFAKVIQQDGELEWTPKARSRDHQFHLLANLAALVGTIAILAIIGMLVWKFAIQPTTT
ncbi:MAG: hypothetical protein NTU79_00595 [Planctomycetota bacterium]|nr:hypothetical protein [Planctomycetota bacterium]